MTSPPGRLDLPRGSVRLPAFLPDATAGVVRSVDSVDLAGCGVEALMMNTYHLMRRPGSTVVAALGGLHRMAGWERPIMTDSGGFQAYSLVRENRRAGHIDDDGITFRPEGAGRTFHLTPEKTIELQLRFGADVVVCLDDCTHVDAPLAEQRAAVQRTVAWARRGKAEYERRLAEYGAPPDQRPRLFAVIQGGGSRELRRECAEGLLAIGFDGYGYGGWPLDRQNRLLLDLIAYTRELVPSALPMHALGIGHPSYVVQSCAAGYDLFDSALPTRDARQGRLYVWRADPGRTAAPERDWCAYLYIQDERHARASRPVDPSCDCLGCTRYPAGYLHHLVAINESLALRLATIHNLRFMMRLMDYLRAGRHERPA